MAERYLKNSLILSAVLLLPSLVNSNSDIFKSFLLRVDELNLVKEEVSVQREMVENLTRVVEVQEQLLLQQNVDMRLGKLENKASKFFFISIHLYQFIIRFWLSYHFAMLLLQNFEQTV